MGIVQRVEDYTDCRAKRKDRTGSLLDRLCSIRLCPQLIVNVAGDYFGPGQGASRGVWGPKCAESNAAMGQNSPSPSGRVPETRTLRCQA